MAKGDGKEGSKGRGVAFRAPASRHYLSKVSQKTIAKSKNTVIGPGVDVYQDMEAIHNGKGERRGNTVTVNERMYGIKANGTLYPISGAGLYQLNRSAFKALGVYNTFGGTAKASEILDKMGITTEDRNTAQKVWSLNLKGEQ